jgi:5-methylcytosine-specific restriction endonuclease McrA
MTHRTLLLNAYYVPIRILRWEDAVKMRYEGTADVVAEYQATVSSPSVTWQVPAVIRLRRQPPAKKRGIKFSRVNLYERDNYQCQYCPPSAGRRKARELTYDHVVPRAAGGRTEWSNIVAACAKHNALKGSRTTDESGLFPRNRPVQPKSLRLRGPVIDRQDAPAEWLEFLPERA